MKQTVHKLGLTSVTGKNDLINKYCCVWDIVKEGGTGSRARQSKTYEPQVTWGLRKEKGACYYTHPVNHELGTQAWGSSSVGKVFTVGLWGPKFSTTDMYKDWVLWFMFSTLTLQVDRKNPGASWAASLATSVNSRPVGDSALKNKVDGS